MTSAATSGQAPRPSGIGWWRSAKRWPGWVVLGVVVIGLFAFAVERDSGPRTPEERIEAISRRLACPICDGESVFESRNNASAAIKREITAQVSEGTRTDEQIISFVEERYGSRVLLVPRATGIDALVWILPVAVFVCAVTGLAFAFRRWQRAADTVPTEADRALVAEALRHESASAEDRPAADDDGDAGDRDAP